MGIIPGEPLFDWTLLGPSALGWLEALVVVLLVIGASLIAWGLHGR